MKTRKRKAQTNRKQIAIEFAYRLNRQADLLEAIAKGVHNALTLWSIKYNVPLQEGGDWKDRVIQAIQLIGVTLV